MKALRQRIVWIFCGLAVLLFLHCPNNSFGRSADCGKAFPEVIVIEFRISKDCGYSDSFSNENRQSMDCSDLIGVSSYGLSLFSGEVEIRKGNSKSNFSKVSLIFKTGSAGSEHKRCERSNYHPQEGENAGSDRTIHDIIGGVVGLVVGVCLVCVFWTIYYKRKAMAHSEIRVKTEQN
jgi:hypothetical protein